MKIRHFQSATIAAFILVLLLIGAYVFFKQTKIPLKTYTNENYGISFNYPNSYELTETSASGAQPGTIVTLTDKGVPIPVNGEGPTAITVAMYDGTGSAAIGNKDPLLSWIKTSPYSNFTLSNQADPGMTTVGDEDARLYTWDGLYQGTTVVALHGGNVIMFSVTYDGQADLEKRQDLTDLIASVKWNAPGMTSSTVTYAQ